MWTLAGFVDIINKRRVKGWADIKVGKMIAQKFDGFNSARGLVTFGTIAMVNRN